MWSPFVEEVLQELNRLSCSSAAPHQVTALSLIRGPQRDGQGTPQLSPGKAQQKQVCRAAAASSPIFYRYRAPSSPTSLAMPHPPPGRVSGGRIHCCLQHKGALSPGKLPWIHLALGKKVSSLPPSALECGLEEAGLAGEGPPLLLHAGKGPKDQGAAKEEGIRTCTKPCRHHLIISGQIPPASREE